MSGFRLLQLKLLYKLSCLFGLFQKFQREVVLPDLLAKLIEVFGTVRVPGRVSRPLAIAAEARLFCAGTSLVVL